MVRKARSLRTGKRMASQQKPFWQYSLSTSQIPMEKITPHALMFLAGPGRVLISHPMVPASRIKQWCSNSPTELSQGLPSHPCLAEAGRECQLPSWVAFVWLSGDLIFHSLLGGQQCSYSPAWALSVGCPECPAST